MLSLKRITTSEQYLPFIDGLRFLAIVPVVLDHFSQAYDKKFMPASQSVYTYVPHLTSWIGNPHTSVLLFFAISGFILGLPFAKSYLNKTEKPVVKDYLVRRLTRLEPPYLAVLTIILLIHVLVLHKSSWAAILPHYLASFFYVHNILFQEYPTLNFVFWSLEIELQFYLLAPLLANVFSLNSTTRRVLLVFVMFCFGLLNDYVTFPFISLLNYLHYFLAGFLALDVYLAYTKPQTSYLFDLSSVLLLVLCWTSLVTEGILLPFVLTAFIVSTHFSSIWHKLLSLSWITLIGGMCYSIYMLHHPLMAFFVNRFHPAPFSELLMVDFSVRLLVSTLLVLFVSALFFVCIERPTMKKKWYKKSIFASLTRTTSTD